jgi:hypothetical protein
LLLLLRRSTVNGADEPLVPDEAQPLDPGALDGRQNAVERLIAGPGLGLKLDHAVVRVGGHQPVEPRRKLGLGDRRAVPGEPAALVEGESVDAGKSRLAGGVPTGSRIFTEWVAIGTVRMNMMRRTSITSIRGVVLRFAIGASGIAAKAGTGRRIASLLFVVCDNITSAIGGRQAFLEAATAGSGPAALPVPAAARPAAEPGR